MSNQLRSTSQPVPNSDELLFLGLIRDRSMGVFTGRAAELSDEELRAVYALAKGVLKQSGSYSTAPQHSVYTEQEAETDDSIAESERVTKPAPVAVGDSK